MKTVIEMAREAGFPIAWISNSDGGVIRWADIERFAALVAAAKEAEHKEAMRWDIHSCGPTCKRYACVATREAVAAEREACAKVCDAVNAVEYKDDHWYHASEKCAAAIRARSNT